MIITAVIQLPMVIQITKNTTKTARLEGNMITLNNFFARWITDIGIRQYPDDTRILPTNNNVDVCQFAASQLKYLPEESVEAIKNQLLYSNKLACLAEGTDRTRNNDDDAAKRTDQNLDYRIREFKDLIFKKIIFVFL